MTVVADSELLFPLSYFCRESGAPLPPCEVIHGSEVPEPYRSLLVHQGDMTSRLEEFHGAPMKLRVLHREIEGDAYRREVLLCAQDTGLPVEYGAIEINLEAFAPELREQILEGRYPLGGLLNHAGVRYRSEPRAFLKLAPDSVMDAHFDLDGAHTLYGRCNVLLGGDRRVLARIVEVLRP
jgi:chorismate-pyruvate lyase